MTDPREDRFLQAVDDEVRRAAKAMLRTARFGAMALVDVDGGGPMAGRVGLATDTDGMPMFPVSSLSGRTASLTLDGRASLLVGEPGAGDPLAHGRLTMNGVVSRMQGEDHERARRRYLARHPAAELYIDFEDFSIWRLHIADASFVAGFARAYALGTADLETAFEDWAAWHAMEPGAVEHMNKDHADATALYATVLCGGESGSWRITGLDPEGIDMALGDDHRRLFFDTPLRTPQELRPRLVALVREARGRAQT